MAPRKTIIASALFSFILSAIFLWLTYSTPWLGINFSSKAHVSGLLVEEVNKTGPSHSILTPGMRIIEVGNGQQSIILSNKLLIPEPSDSANFSDYNQLIFDNNKLYNILLSKEVWLKDHLGNIFKVRPQPYRHLSSLQFDHLIIILFAALAFVFHVMLAVFKKHTTSVQVLTITALSFCLLIMTGQTSFFRELVIHPQVFLYAHPMQMLCALFFAYFLMGLLLYYPTQLVSKKFIYLLFTLPTIFWLNMMTQSFELADNSYLMQFNILFFISLSFAALQWKKARGLAIEMAQFKWLFLAMVTGAGLNIALNIYPQSQGQEAYVGITFVLLFSYLIFIGIAIGMYRYKLFNIDKWWFSIWSWFFAGLLVILLDITFVSLLNLDNQTAVIASMIIIGWIYFPIRQRMLQHFSFTPNTTIAQHLPAIVLSISSITNKSEINSLLLKTLKKIFNAKNASTTNGVSLQPQLNDSGLSLQLPGINEDCTLVLDFADDGARLFSYDDISLASGIRSLFSHYYSAIDSKQNGASEERERIMGDLHDELGPKLLTLIHSLKKPSLIELARDSMGTLRDIVYSVQYEEAMPLSELLASERASLTERASEKNKTIIWNLEDNLGQALLKPDAVLHIKRILNELMSNELRHGSASTITISSYLHKNITNVKFSSDNSPSNIEEWKNGVGLSNLNRRSKALNGSINWYSHHANNSSNICFKLSFPNNMDTLS